MQNTFKYKLLDFGGTRQKHVYRLMDRQSSIQ